MIAQISFLSHIHTTDPTVAQAAQVLGGSNRKDYYFMGNADELARIFYDRVQQAGGEIRDDAFVEKLLRANRRIMGARLNSYEGVVTARTYLGNVEIHHLFGLFEPFSQPRNLRRKLATLQPSFARCGFYLAVRKNVLPEGMKDNVVFVADDQKDLVGDNFIFVHVYPDRHQSEVRMLHISFLLPYPRIPDVAFQEFESTYQKTVRRVIQHLTWLIPFLQENLLLTFPNPANGSKLILADQKKIQRFPLLHGVYSLTEHDPRLQFGFQNTTPLRNLFLTGPEVFPALGFEGETVSSLRAAQEAYHHFRHHHRS